MLISEADYNQVILLRRDVMYPGENIDFVKLEEDSQGIHIGVFEGEELISVVSIFIKDRKIQFRKLATRNDKQGKGYASALVRWLIDYVKDMKLDSLWCNARKEVVPFYKKFGFKTSGLYFSKNEHEYIVMELIVERS